MPPKKNRQRNQLLITAGVMGALLVGGGVAVLMLPSGDAPAPVVSAPEEPAAEVQSPSADAAPAETAGPELVDDDGRTLWASPTDGAPMPLGWLPAGVEFVLSVRLAEALETADGRIVAEMFAGRLRPLSEQLQRAGVRLSEVDRLTVGLRPAAQFGVIDAAWVVETKPTPGAEGGVRALGDGPLGRLMQVAPGRLLLAQRETVDKVLATQGAAPPLQRELEELAERSDGDRHVNLLVAPSFLFAEPRPLFRGEVAALAGPLFDETPTRLKGVLASVHWAGDLLYWELRSVASAELRATELTAQLRGRLSQWPSELQMAILDLNPAPHGRRVVANLPAMTRVAAEHARRGVDNRQAVLNGYLPDSAGHNLLLAAELMLAQQSAGVRGGATAAPAGRKPLTPAERLQQPATVVFDRDTLEMALRYLSDEIDLPIVILGGDLQLDGITKNQSFGLDERNKPGGAVLLEILTRANPDKTATGPADPRQKLVYLLKPDDNGVQTVYVTTRAAATKRGDKLPSIFAP